MDVSYVAQREEQRGGFQFDNLRRNELIANGLSANGKKFLTARKTGTTICGVKCANAVVIGADTRATEGMIVADKNCDKLHKIAENVWCGGAGTSADLEHTTGLMASKIELHRLATNTQPRVTTVVTMLSQMLFKYQGHVSCALVLGGVDINGAQLYKVFPHGSTDRSPFAAMGSGSLCAEGRLEAGYKDGMTIEEGKELVTAAIKAGILNDLGSGGNVDLVVIEKDKTTHCRTHEEPVAHLKRVPHTKGFPLRTTPILLEKIRQIKSQIVVEEVTSDDVEMTVGV